MSINFLVQRLLCKGVSVNEQCVVLVVIHENLKNVTVISNFHESHQKRHLVYNLRQFPRNFIFFLPLKNCKKPTLKHSII